MLEISINWYIITTQLAIELYTKKTLQQRHHQSRLQHWTLCVRLKEYYSFIIEYVRCFVVEGHKVVSVLFNLY